MQALRSSLFASARPAFAAPRIAARAYHAKVIDHYENPRNVGKLNKDDEDVGTGLVGAPGEFYLC
jgi:hypothetical protein